MRDGLELDRHYAYRWCTPTRSATLSGRLPVHVFEGGGGTCNEHFGIPRGMTVIGSKLKSAGYSTHQFGKASRPPRPRPFLPGASLTCHRRAAQWDAGNASPDHIPLGRGFDSSLGYFDHCNDYNTYRPQTPFHNENGAVADSGPCDPNVTMTDLWDTDGPAALLAGHGVYEERLLSDRAEQILAAHDPAQPLFFYVRTRA